MPTPIFPYTDDNPPATFRYNDDREIRVISISMLPFFPLLYRGKREKYGVRLVYYESALSHNT